MHLGVPHRPAISGTWALLEFPTGSSLAPGSANYNVIRQALQFTDMTGFCARIHVDQLSPTNGSFSTTFLNQILACVNSVPNRKLAVRLIGGRYTPGYVFDTLGARGYPVTDPATPAGNGRIPYPCHADGTPNVEYINWLQSLATDLKAWMTSQGNDSDGQPKCPLMHMTWFSNQYSEFYHGPIPQADSSVAEFVAASNAIIDMAYALSDSNLTVSFGMSGKHVEDVQTGVINHMTGLAGDWSSRLYFTANGLDQTGDWGATTEAQQDGNTGMAVSGVFTNPAGKRVSRGEQDINPGDWPPAYLSGQVDQIILNKADFWEHYCNNGVAFGGTNAGALQTQVTRLRNYLNGGVTPTPPAITSFTPTYGPTGTVVTITGTGFTGATSVSFGGRPASFTVVSGTSITATVPSGATTGVVQVANGAGVADSTTLYEVTPAYVQGVIRVGARARMIH